MTPWVIQYDLELGYNVKPGMVGGDCRGEEVDGALIAEAKRLLRERRR